MKVLIVKINFYYLNFFFIIFAILIKKIEIKKRYIVILSRNFSFQKFRIFNFFLFFNLLKYYCVY